MSWIELEPQTLLANTDHIDWVERGDNPGTENIVSYWSGAAEHKITYVDAAAAEAAIDEWLAIVAPPPPPQHLKVGDVVYIQHPDQLRNGKSFQHTITRLMSADKPWWEVTDNITGTKAIVTTPVTLIRVDP